MLGDLETKKKDPFWNFWPLMHYFQCRIADIAVCYGHTALDKTGAWFLKRHCSVTFAWNRPQRFVFQFYIEIPSKYVYIQQLQVHDKDVSD